MRLRNEPIRKSWTHAGPAKVNAVSKCATSNSCPLLRIAALTDCQKPQTLIFSPHEHRYVSGSSREINPLISPTLEIPDHVGIGEEVLLEAVDATTNLSDLGYDSSLDFALGTGDPDSYLYSWYRDSASDENLIGSGRVFSYTVGLGDEAHPGMDLITQSIILEVTDSLSPRPPSTSYDQVQLNVVPPVYLPLVLRNSQ